MGSDTKMITVDRFLGIDESADGFTELKAGQASKMINWYVTDAFNICTRPGIQRVDFDQNRGEEPILAAWAGYAGDREYLIVVDWESAMDRIWMYAKDEDGQYKVVHRQDGMLGLADADGAYVKIFPFCGRVYIMSAGNTVYYEDGVFREATIYVPKVITGADPAGGGTELEGLNMLTPLRKIDYCGDGEATKYVLPGEAEAVTAVTVDGEEMVLADAGTFDAESHTFTFAEAPSKGLGNVEMTYGTNAQTAQEMRMRIICMTLAENYNGSTDTRLFVAGDGSNVCYYSGAPAYGDISQLYFPAMNEIRVDMSASPITALVRHYSRLLVFKPDGAYTIIYEPVTQADGSVIAGFFLRTANREFGNEAMGQVCTVQNHPRTLSQKGVYEWRITSTYYQDERYALRVSDPVAQSLAAADFQKIVACDDTGNKTYYIFLNDSEGTVLVNRYALTKEGIWSLYKSNLCTDVRYAMIHGGTMAFVTATELFYFQPGAATDAPLTSSGDNQIIDAIWESGFWDFGCDYRQKYSSKIYISMLPETSSNLLVTAVTDRRESYATKITGHNLFSFAQMDLRSFSFNMNATPKIRRVRLKVKKFVYYKLVLRVNEYATRATVLGYDQQVRFASMVK